MVLFTGMTWVYFFTTESNVFQRGSDHLLYYDKTFLLWWEWSLLRWQCLQPWGRRDHWVVWWTIKNIWLLRSASTYGKFELLDSALLHHHQNKQTKYLGKTAFPSIHQSSKVSQNQSQACCGGTGGWSIYHLSRKQILRPLCCHLCVQKLALECIWFSQLSLCASLCLCCP